LHLGSLLAATASYLDARVHGLAWQVRLDDLDRPRNEPGAEQAILQALERHGLYWDGPVVRQSDHVDRYLGALARLSDKGLLFHCSCSRKNLAAHAVYPGTCREQRQPRWNTSVRVRVDDAQVDFEDLVQGPQRDALARSTGDFVVRRRDGVIAYQLATAVDDGDAQITRVIRGRDLLENTPRQIFLMRCLDLEVPQYGHIPLIVNAAGQKLSKQTGARALDVDRPIDNLIRVLRGLGATVDTAAIGLAAGARTGAEGQSACESLLAAAWPGWSLQRITGRHDMTVEP
jgi:glutamyl-Q tRNA(Asp) synthetase